MLLGIPLVLLACSDAAEPTAPTGATFARPASGAVVNSLADPGDGICDAAECTLREALASPAWSEINFARALEGGTITLDATSGALVINGRFISITGPAKGIVIRRNDGDPPFGLVTVENGARARLANLTLTGGARDFGGAISVDAAELSLVNVTVWGNRANVGGGISVSEGSQLFMTGSVVRNNLAAYGGGIGAAGSRASVTGSTIRDNTAAWGGGIYTSSELMVQSSTIQGNVAVGEDGTFEGGGGIYVFGSAGPVEIVRTTVSGNSATEGSGGGILVINNSPQILTITRSTLSGNVAAEWGGGIYSSNSAPLLINSTLSGNAALFGGGIWSILESVTYLRSSTVVENAAAAGGGIGTLGGGDLDLINSLVALNTASQIDPDVSKAASTSLSASFNLIGDGTGSGITDGDDDNLVGTSASPIDPRIGRLAANGGPTKTHALMTGSPAIDVGSTAGGICFETDQRGVSRPQGPRCDIGSFEREVNAKKGKPGG